MTRHDTLIIKDTHRGLLYEDGVFREILPAGRYQIPREPSPLAAFFGAKGPRVEVALVDVRGRDRAVAVHDLITADGATISASFLLQYRVVDPVAALHRVKNFEERLASEAQTAARRVLRGLNVDEILGSRDEIGEEVLLQVREAAGASGLEVTGLDFRDLTVPDDLRKLMNRAVLARRLRQLPAPPVDDHADGLDEAAVDDDAGLIIARATFDRARQAGPEPDGRREALPIRPVGQPLSASDSGLLRCHP